MFAQTGAAVPVVQALRQSLAQPCWPGCWVWRCCSSRSPRLPGSPSCCARSACWRCATAPSAWRRLGDPGEGRLRRRGLPVGHRSRAGAVWAAAAGRRGRRSRRLLWTPPQGAQLVSMTGRDQIWAIAMEEWQANPLFGYGPGLWDEAYPREHRHAQRHQRAQPVHGHAGALGQRGRRRPGALCPDVLLVLSVRYARPTQAASAWRLFVALALRSISEVPLMHVRLWHGALRAPAADHHAGFGRRRPRARAAEVRATPIYRSRRHELFSRHSPVQQGQLHRGRRALGPGPDPAAAARSSWSTTARPTAAPSWLKRSAIRGVRW